MAGSSGANDKPAFSRTFGEGVARRLFNARGNHAEIHLSEAELAAIVDESVMAAIEFGYSPQRRPGAVR